MDPTTVAILALKSMALHRGTLTVYDAGIASLQTDTMLITCQATPTGVAISMTATPMDPS